jgi:predicted RNA-binding Zn-ribbon protein involved in translation (DUF1610 family)
MYTINAKGEKVVLKRKNVGSVDFNCPNCGRGYHRTLWEHVEPGSDDEEFGGFVSAYVDCRCGAKLLVGDSGEDCSVYWLNKAEMQQRAWLKLKTKIRPGQGLYYDLIQVPHGHVPVGKVFLWKRFPLLVREFRDNSYFKCPECGAPSFFKVNYQCPICDDGRDDEHGWLRPKFRRRERRDYFRKFLKDLEVLVLPVLALMGKAWYVRSERRHWRDGDSRRHPGRFYFE